MKRTINQHIGPNNISVYKNVYKIRNEEVDIKIHLTTSTNTHNILIYFAIT